MYGGVVMPGRRTQGQVLASTYSYNAESQKQGSNRFNSITKMIHFANLGILFIYDVKYENWGFHSFGASQKPE